MDGFRQDPDVSVGTPSGAVRRVDWETFRRAAQTAGATLPVEQTAAWDSFDAAVPGREPWGRIVYLDQDGQPRALISFTRMEVRGAAYLWSRHAPVWLGGEPCAAEEADLRELLVRGVRYHDPSVVFLRMHLRHEAPGLHELLQTMTYDRTVVLSLDHPDDESFLESFTKRGRRDVRKALRATQVTYRDETACVEEVFGSLYSVLEETGERDGFRAAPEEHYRTMLRTLGQDHSRLYVARDEDGKALAWCIDAFSGDGAVHYYAASTAEGRRLGAADALLYKAGCWLRQEGVRTWDLMGVDSERVPDLAGVGVFKNKFTVEGPVDVPGAWDVAVHPGLYAALRAAKTVKTWAGGGRRGVRATLRGCATILRAVSEDGLSD